MAVMGCALNAVTESIPEGSSSIRPRHCASRARNYWKEDRSFARCRSPNRNMPEQLLTTYDICRLPDSVADPGASVAAVPARCRELKHMIGNTPLLAIRFRFRGRERLVYAKAEHINMTGSIKDRMAFHILKKAYQEGKIQPGDTIAEATSGNTGISFAAIGRALGHQVVIFMPDWMSQERVSLIRSLSAKIVPVRRDQGGFLGSIRMTEELAEHQPHIFLPAQFANEANAAAHQISGPVVFSWASALPSLAD